MTTIDPNFFHKLYGQKSPRVHSYGRDFFDYTIMTALSALIIGLTYGVRHPMSIVGFVLCAGMVVTFVKRHGVEYRVPVILRKPQELLFMFVYKLRNLKWVWFVAVGLLLLENWAIAATPNLPHHVELLRKISFGLFYLHLLGITVYRTVVLVAHLRKKELVREVLMQTPWKRVVNEKTSITLEIFHAYFTGLLTHIVLLAPWYLVITHFKFSVLFLPVVGVINFFVEWYWLKAHNAWFYRDHWLGHNSELEFVLLHGTHHDAIPSGLIGVADHGFLEGFLRGALAFPDPFFHPAVAFLTYTNVVKRNIDAHQYIPGIFPKMGKGVMKIVQHSTHHYGSLEPYSFGLKVDQPGITEAFKKAVNLPEELANSIRLDEELNGFKWDNPTYHRTLSLYEKYHQ